MAEQTVNIPQIIAVLLVGFLVVRWFFFPSRAAPATRRNGARQISPEQVDNIQQMFPQLDRRSIIWDLHRNGGSVQATTERVLSGRSLDTPPPSFQPPMPRTATTATSSSASKPKSSQPDLITRYNLTSKITQPSSDDTAASSGATAAQKEGWSANRMERSEAFKRRREEMVLAARRKMEQREAQKASGSVPQ